MKVLRYAIIGFAVLAFAAMPVSAGQLTLNIDENLNWSIGGSWPGFPQVGIQADPMTGTSTEAIQLPLPFASVGDVLINDQAGWGSCPPTCASDLLRFENIQPFGSGGPTLGYIFVYSTVETPPSVADVGLPSTDTNYTLTEQGFPNWNWIDWAPTSGQPGYISTDYSLSIHFVSDIPEPATLLLLGGGLALFGTLRRRRRA